MEYFIQQLVNGITLGSIYGLDRHWLHNGLWNYWND